ALLDIGRSNADGGWYGGLTPASPDTNGNYWNTLDIGKYAGSMKDKTNGVTSWGTGFINTNNPTFSWYNGPAGDNTAAWSINEAALGDLGNKDAAFDFVKGTNIRMSLGGLTSGKKYRLNFYCSRRWEGDPSTTISGLQRGHSLDPRQPDPDGDFFVRQHRGCQRRRRRAQRHVDPGTGRADRC
ncbi:MAG: hypothetical protein RL549_1422, partial [Verrucomicrobiota bacterium]